MRRDKLGKGADIAFARPPVNHVAHFEALHFAAHGAHHTGKIVAQNQRHIEMQQQFELAVADFEIHRIHAGGVDFGQNFVFADCGHGHISQAQGLSFAVALNQHGFHGGHGKAFRRKNNWAKDLTPIAHILPPPQESS